MNCRKCQPKHLISTTTIVIAMVVIGTTNFAGANVGSRTVGEDIFRNRCAVCHGLDGGGDTTLGKKLGVPDLRSEKIQHRTDDDLYATITEGETDMPAFKKKLSKEKTYQVIAHLRTLKKNP